MAGKLGTGRVQHPAQDRGDVPGVIASSEVGALKRQPEQLSVGSAFARGASLLRWTHYKTYQNAAPEEEGQYDQKRQTGS